MTFAELKSAVRETIFPDGEAENLVAPHDRMFVEAMIELQRVVDGLKQNHSTTVPYCSTYFDCQLNSTVIDCPRGTITRVFTLQDDCCPVTYNFTSKLDELLYFSSRFSEDFEIPKAVLAGLPRGISRSSAELDKECGRASAGMFTIHNKRIYICPRIESNEIVVVKWDGMQRDWSDDSTVPDDAEFVNAVSMYVLKQHIMLYEKDKTELAVARGAYAEAVQNLIIDGVQEYTARVFDAPTPSLRNGCTTNKPCCEESTGSPVVQPGAGVFAIISDWGPYPTVDDHTEGSNVEAMVLSWNPEFVVSCGDTRHGTNRYSDVFNEFPYYKSIRSSDMAKNRFWTAMGNHDDDDDSIDPGAAREEFQTFYGYPNNGRYYDVVKGYCHIFFLNGDSEEPDGRSSTSKQAMWLKNKLAVSSKYWNIVVVHQAPYSNESGGVTPTLRWPFALWGADLVVSGHSHTYERFTIDDFPYITCGWSGEKTDPLDTDIAGTEYSADPADRGALACYANSETLIIEAVRSDGTIIDNLVLGVLPSEAYSVAGTPPSSYTYNVTAPQGYPTTGGLTGLGIDSRWKDGRWEFLFPDGLWRYMIPRVVDGVATNSWSDGTA